jgi:hypothetical protein
MFPHRLHAGQGSGASFGQRVKRHSVPPSAGGLKFPVGPADAPAVETGSTRAPRRRGAPDAGFSMIVTMISLVGVALLTLLLLSTTLHSSSTSATGVSNAPGVGLADNLLAQQSLSTALSAVGAAASSAGGYGSIDLGVLSASDPSVTYVNGPTTGASTVSIAVTNVSGASAGGIPATGDSGGSYGSAISRAEAAAAGSAGGSGGSGPTATGSPPGRPTGRAGSWGGATDRPPGSGPRPTSRAAQHRP